MEGLVCIVNYSILSSTTWRNKKIDFFQFPNGKQGFFQWVLENCCGNRLFLPHMICLHFRVLFFGPPNASPLHATCDPPAASLKQFAMLHQNSQPDLRQNAINSLSQPVNNQKGKAWADLAKESFVHPKHKNYPKNQKQPNRSWKIQPKSQQVLFKNYGFRVPDTPVAFCWGPRIPLAIAGLIGH